MDSEEIPSGSKTNGRRTLRIVLAVAAGVAVALARDEIVASASAVGDLSAEAAALLTALTAANLLIGSAATAIALPGLTFGRAVVVHHASAATSNVASSPVGTGAKVAILRSWGFPAPAVGLSVVATGVAGIVVKSVVPLAVLAYVASSDPGNAVNAAALTGLVATLMAVSTITYLCFRYDSFARRAGRVVGRVASPLMRRFWPQASIDWEEGASEVRVSALRLAATRWKPLAVVSVAGYFTQFAVLLASLRLTGVPETVIGTGSVLTAFALMRVVSSVPVTPGGVGVIEAALVTSLVASGAPSDGALAAVVVFRAMTYLVPTALGAAAWAAWKARRPLQAVHEHLHHDHLHNGTDPVPTTSPAD